MGRKLPSMLQKQVFQEAASCCAFCNEKSVPALEIHHIDEDRTNNAFENLILVCSTCHSKITHGEISQADVLVQKRIMQSQAQSNRTALPHSSQNVTVAHTQNTGIIANVVTIRGKGTPKTNYPNDSIGADTIKNGYIHYLYGRYVECRKGDASFGAIAHSQRFHPGELHRTIRSKFKTQTFFIHVSRFCELVEYMQGRIDQTILGRYNRSRHQPNYQSFEAYRREQLGTA